MRVARSKPRAGISALRATALFEIQSGSTDRLLPSSEEKTAPELPDTPSDAQGGQHGRER